MKKTDVLLVGISGYGRDYLKALEGEGTATIRAVVDPYSASSPDYERLHKAGVCIFDTMEDCLASGVVADLAIIVSPIAFHAHQACLALEAGMNVLCEKPVCATVADAQRMKEASQRSGKFLEVGYQWSFSETIQNLKRDILAGDFGTPQRMKTYIAWPRRRNYFRRNSWSGKITDARGAPVYDSPVNNAAAHFLFNMLFLAGRSQGTAATPLTIEAECYRGNDIENYDTACCRIETNEGVDVWFFATHCCNQKDGPVFSLLFDKGRVDYVFDGQVMATFPDGRTKEYGGLAYGADDMRKLSLCLERCRSAGPVRPICGVEAAMKHTQCVEAIQLHVPIHPLPENLLEEAAYGDDSLVYLPGLIEDFKRAFESEKLLSELQRSWTSAATRVLLEC